MRGVALAAAFAVAAGLAGCAPRPADKTAARLKEVQEEGAPDKLVMRGRAFATVGDHARAEQYFAAALDRGADPQVVLPMLMRVCAESQRYRAAIDYAEPYLKKHPGDYRLRFVVASFHLTIGENAAAREQMDLVIKSRPDFAPVRFALGVLLRDEAGDVVSADAQFREYLRLDPRGPHAEEARASLLKMVDPGGAPITVPPVWHEIATPPKEDGAKRSVQ